MNRLARWWRRTQALLFRKLEAGVDEPLTERHEKLALVLEVVRVEEHVRPRVRW
jgi:hypothetical protein